jgi:hypothetical protein
MNAKRRSEDAGSARLAKTLAVPDWPLVSWKSWKCSGARGV